MISVELKDADKLIDTLEARIAKAKRAGTLSAAMRLVGIIQNELIPAEKPAPVDQALYRAAWHAEQTSYGAVVYNDSPHAPIIEWGARASKIQFSKKIIDALAEWVVRKGLVGGGPGSIDERGKLPEPRDIAFAIVQSMKKRGIFNRDEKGLRIAQKAAARVPRLVAEEIAAEIKEAMRAP